MVSEWKEFQLGELTENFDSIRVPVKEVDRRPGKYPYYGASGVVDSIDSYLFDGEYLLIAEDGENLRTRNTPMAFIARGKFWVNNHAHIVRGNEQADTRFLLYVLSATDISGYLTGSTMPKLTQSNMNRIPVLKPPLSEQRAIAHILGTLDDKIELNRKMNETLEAMARALFKSWFVDFDPVRRNAAKGRRPSPGAKRHPLPVGEGRGEGVIEGTAFDHLFPDSFEDSELGKIPKGWRVGKFDELATIGRDSINPGDFPDEAFNHFSIPAFDEGQRPKNELGINIKSNKFIVESESVLLSKLNPRIPRIWLPVVRINCRSICSTEFLVMLPQIDISREYLYCFISSKAFIGIFETLVTGTSGSHQRVKSDGLINMDVIVPDSQLIYQFTRIAKPLLKKVEQGREEIGTLAAIRDKLLPKLISGEIHIKDTEIF